MSSAPTPTHDPTIFADVGGDIKLQCDCGWKQLLIGDPRPKEAMDAMVEHLRSVGQGFWADELHDASPAEQAEGQRLQEKAPLMDGLQIRVGLLDTLLGPYGAMIFTFTSSDPKTDDVTVQYVGSPAVLTKTKMLVRDCVNRLLGLMKGDRR